MSLDTRVKIEPATCAVIRVKFDRFDLMTRVLGCESDIQRGVLIDMNSKAIGRARAGNHVGSTFVANTLAALRSRERELVARNLHPTFEELFEVVVVSRSEVAA